MGEGVLDYFFSGRGDVLFGIFGIIFFWERGFWIIFFLGEGMFCLGILISERVKDWGRWSVFQVGRKGREI